MPGCKVPDIGMNYGAAAEKVSGRARIAGLGRILLKNAGPSMAAMQMLHCTIRLNRLHSRSGGKQAGAMLMGFRTEFFSRPRPQEESKYRAALALLNAMSNADRADIGVKPADFPRLAREMALK